jgi:hypothetical protein
MPVYCFREEDGTIHERVFSMKDDIPKAIEVDGNVATRDLLSEHRRVAHAPGNWPLCSDALGVHPSQVGEAVAHAQKIGVPTEFNSEGQAVFTSAAHRKRYARAVGFRDRNGGYSDP